MSIKIAQTFYIDKTVVRGAAHVTIDSIDLYFRNKPRNRNNRSGITEPGVSVYVCPVKDDDVPDLTRIFETGLARQEYNSIVASRDASIKTKFKFNNPLVLETNKSYAIAVAFDGNEEYRLWTVREGDTLVGTNTRTSGSNAQNVGKFYQYTRAGGTWRALPNVDLKFSIFACRYGANTASNTYVIPSSSVEYIMYNRYHPKTLRRDKLKMGEMAFQETPVIYGTVSVNAQSTTIKSSNNINFSTLFPAPAVSSGRALTFDPVLGQHQYIVLRNGSTQTVDADVVRILSVVSNTELLLERLPTFTNNSASFSVTACGEVDNHTRHFFTGRWFHWTDKIFKRWKCRKADLVRLNHSNANSTIRFTNNNVESITINSGGTGYSNSDVVTVYPILDANTANSEHIAYIEEYANAVANVITNGSGTITGLSITNAGWGLTSNVAISITTSGGSAANLEVDTGCTIRGSESNAHLSDCVVVSMPVHRTFPRIMVERNHHHDWKIIQHYPFHFYPDKEHRILQANTCFKKEVHDYKNSRVIDLVNNDNRILCLPSHSHVMRKGANCVIQLANGAIHTTRVKSPSIVEIPVTSNNEFTIPAVVQTQVYNYTYIINDDITGETKGNGNALARHISNKVTFAKDRDAEDIVVYCDVYKPAGTNLHVYARLHNRSDQEAFDDKDWTKLEIKSDNGSYISSLTDEKDIVELTFGLPTSPPSVNAIAGYATCTEDQANVAGIDTAWSTDLKVNDVVKVYSELFPENYMISVVRSIANNTSITLDDNVTNPSLAASNCKLDLIGRPNDGTNAEIGNPFQAFVYTPNSSVCRYYDSSMSKMDAYNTFQIKLVLTSNNESIVPKVWNTRAVGVSA